MTKNNNNHQLVDKTELVWPGKRKEVERVDLPFQTIETINLPRGRRQKDIFDSLKGQKKIIKDRGQLKVPQQEEWKNRLIWGDNLLIMGSLLKEFAGKINLIYIDPPFATGDDFSFKVQIGDQEIIKEPSALEMKAYRDTWGKGMQSYLQMMYDRLVLMKELLADDGSIYIHCDWRLNSYLRLVLDEIFGRDNFRNEISWKKSQGARGVSSGLNNYIRLQDSILFYSRGSNNIYNNQKMPYAETTLNMFKYKDKRGQFRLNILRNYSDETINKMEKEGRIFTDEKGKKHLKQYLEEDSGVSLSDIWTDISTLGFTGEENVGYPTQKPKALLDRIIKVSSNEGDLIADFFCGSGTAGVVAERLGRRWIMSDLGRFAIHTARKRLLDLGAKPFVVQNLGKYERHRWVQLNGRYKNYLKFILELYHTEPVEGFTNLHGKKDKAFVRVGAVDAPVTLSEIREALSECKENKIKSLDVLGWEWEMGLHDLVKEEAERYGVKL